VRYLAAKKERRGDRVNRIGHLSQVRKELAKIELEARVALRGWWAE
jgi:hypothetical protein